MKKHNKPLVQALVKFKESTPISFHVPGHKNGTLSGLPVGLRSALQYDFTELEGLDDLHEPESVLKIAQQKLATLYGANRSFFLVNGSTVGNLAMIYATCSAEDVVIVQRNAHKSVFHAIELTGAIPIFVMPSWDNKSGTVGAVTAMQIQEVLELHSNAKAVILTYPTYYGVTGTNLEEVIKICHLHEVPVLVDEAHGAHFVIGDPFPQSALEMGADVVVHSAHKTLPAMTMASFLHVKSNLISPKRIAHYLHMLQSSSPSYLLMASLDDARDYAETYNKDDKINFVEQRSQFMKRLEEIPSLQMIETDDPLKLIIRSKNCSGFTIQKRLEAEGVYVELADPFQVLLVLPLLKCEHNYPFEEISNKIRKAFAGVNESTDLQLTTEPLLLGQGISKLYYSSKELEGLETEWISYKAAVDSVAAAAVIPYPPGIPLLLAGEMVTKEHVQSLSTLIARGAKFQGAIDLNKKEIVVVRRETEE
ncbi:aminotransferase class I/II-fold pyridoxal phosphate-dependent enzyme [Sporosarcina sp. G11-34]|uniref:aminotransferase class I/II-fold pyridoxal phosphate-dependent enzyme n=1 Tax=Sporosarcina sp. G11-34 TaxID=2849605 RepID=UPI0022A8D326|nr:aminotransferase class I/II-fold pyridoxal phosphate-dependent enzyme [Sporosarcina sp. G11-34]MCZ2260549.1 aminotransferase class I/II-fold pyridoxal phosphate-dependent enzyme [Sporosarcina sp. G11-34]